MDQMNPSNTAAVISNQNQAINQNQDGPEVSLPKSFFDLQLKKPKNQHSYASLNSNIVDALGRHIYDHQAQEEYFLHKKKVDKEKELKALQQVLRATSAKRSERIDDSDADMSLYHHQNKPSGRAISGIKREDDFLIPPMEGVSRREVNANEPASRPSGPTLQPPQRVMEASRSQSPEMLAEDNLQLPQLPQMPALTQAAGAARYSQFNPSHSPETARNQGNAQSRLPSAKQYSVTPALIAHSAFNSLQDYDQRMLYNAHDMDANRRANQAFNGLTNIRFLGAGRPASDPELGRLRQIQRNLTNREMLEEQMAEKRRKKMEEKLRRKKEDEREEARVKRENEEIERKLEEERRKEKEKKAKVQKEK